MIKKKEIFLRFKVEDDTVTGLSYNSQQLIHWRSPVRMSDKDKLVSTMLVLFPFSNIASIGAASTLLCTCCVPETNDLPMFQQSKHIQFIVSSRFVGMSMERHDTCHKATHLAHSNLSSSAGLVPHAKQTPSGSQGYCWAIAGEIRNQRDDEKGVELQWASSPV